MMKNQKLPKKLKCLKMAEFRHKKIMGHYVCVFEKDMSGLIILLMFQSITFQSQKQKIRRSAITYKI